MELQASKLHQSVVPSVNSTTWQVSTLNELWKKMHPSLLPSPVIFWCPGTRAHDWPGRIWICKGDDLDLCAHTDSKAKNQLHGALRLPPFAQELAARACPEPILSAARQKARQSEQ